MKAIVTAMLMGLLVCAGCEKKQEQPVLIEPESAAVVSEPLVAGEGETLQVYELGGMTCEGCQQTIYTALHNLPGVKRASVSLEEEKAWIVADEATSPSEDTIVAAVEAKEYTATPIAP